LLKRLILLALAGALAACAATPARPATSAPMIVLKLDDYFPDTSVHPGWDEAFRFLNAEGVLASVGVVGQGFERPDPHAIQWLLDQHGRGHELWNHGYCHCRSGKGEADVREFRGSSFEDQLRAISRTQALGRDVLGISFTSFGAPYNSTDASTALALARHGELSVWMYKDTSHKAAPTDKRLLDRVAEVNIEYPVHIPDFDQFLTGYAANRDKQVLIIQGHPRSWGDEPERMEEFKRIVRYLKADGARFVTPMGAVSD